MAKIDNSFLVLAFLAIASCKIELEEPIVPLTEFQIEPGFEIICIASEPLIDSPVAIDFDEKGRIWVVEMRGYMPTVEGEGEDAKVGRISILEDRDKDGIMDSKRIFLDSLVMPRALALLENGLLYCEPPNLFFVEIENDQPSNRTLVDSDYAPGLNPEYQANGLLKTKDGWVYSAGADKKYRQKPDGGWEIEKTTMRGQWGITHDEKGRLFYNNNSVLLMADYFPSEFTANPATTNHVSCVDQRIWPNHPTLVNRGYKKGELDSLGRVVHATSACGPLIYLGNNFPESYRGNAFVCVPEGNLLKRLLLSEDDEGRVKAEHASVESEFLRSNDPTFRPVNLKTGPDGNIYLVDMRRGLIQHQAYLSPFLKKATVENGLDKVIGKGRIYRIAFLGGKAPGNIIQNNSSENPVNAVKKFISYDDEKIKIEFSEWISRPDLTVYEKRLALSVLAKLNFLSEHEQFSTATTLLEQLKYDSLSVDILLYSFLYEGNKMDEYINYNATKAAYLQKAAQRLKDEGLQRNPIRLYKNTDERTAGLKIYRTYCVGCHGLDGFGKPKLAPPLVGSSVVNGPKEEIASVIWNGKNTPVMIKGKLEQFAEPMPGFKENPNWNNEMLNAVVAYVKNAFAEPE